MESASSHFAEVYLRHCVTPEESPVQIRKRLNPNRRENKPPAPATHAPGSADHIQSDVAVHFSRLLPPFVYENNFQITTSDIGVMNDMKTSQVPRRRPRFCDHCFVCLGVHAGRRARTSGRYPQTCRVSENGPLGEYLNLLPSHLPVLCSWMEKPDLLLTCDFTQRHR